MTNVGLKPGYSICKYKCWPIEMNAMIWRFVWTDLKGKELKYWVYTSSFKNIPENAEPINRYRRKCWYCVKNVSTYSYNVSLKFWFVLEHSNTTNLFLGFETLHNHWSPIFSSYFCLPEGLNPIRRKKYIISNLAIYFHFLTQWWRTHSNVLA